MLCIWFELFQKKKPLDEKKKNLIVLNRETKKTKLKKSVFSWMGFQKVMSYLGNWLLNFFIRTFKFCSRSVSNLKSYTEQKVSKYKFNSTVFEQTSHHGDMERRGCLHKTSWKLKLTMIQKKIFIMKEKRKNLNLFSICPYIPSLLI